MISDAAELAEQADVFVIIGTSMNVYPAAGLLGYIGRNVPAYLIDPKDVHTGQYDVVHIKRGASEGVKVLTEILLESSSS